MNMTHNPVEPLSYRRFVLDEDEFLTQIRRLLELGYETDPHGGDHCLENKDYRSCDALVTAGELIGPLIQWAVNHQAGVVLNGTDGAPDANDHRHEQDGASYDYSDPVINRRILARLLGALAPALPCQLIFQATDALSALDYGEVQPLFEPVVTGLEGPAYTLAMLRLQAVGYVEFRRGRKENRSDALWHVADAYGCSDDAIDTWERRDLPKIFGRRSVKDLMQRARNHGEFVYQHAEKIGGQDWQGMGAKSFLITWGNDALSRDGLKYKDAKDSK